MGHSVDYALEKANKAFKKGKLEQAEKIFLSVLQVFPDNDRAQNGIAKIQAGKNLEAQKFNCKKTSNNFSDEQILSDLYQSGSFEKVLTEANKQLLDNPDNASALNFKGAALGKLDKLDEALAIFTEVQRLIPNKASPLNNIGSVWREMGNNTTAEMYYKSALQIDPNFYDARRNLAGIYQNTNRIDEAISELKIALEQKPNNVEILNVLGNIYNKMGEKNLAISFYEKILEIEPTSKKVLNNLANVHLSLKNFQTATLLYEKALSIDPEYSDAMNNLGNALKEMGFLDEAIYYYEQAIKAPDAKLELHSNLGVALKDRGRFEEALAAFDRALELKSDYPDAYWNKALAHLASGNFQEGWKGYEWRWQATNFDSTYLPTKKPVWDGKYERVLVWPEQGLGDHIMFSSLFEEFSEKCKLAIFQIDRRLLNLFRRTYPEFYFIPSDKLLDESEYDSHIPLGSIAQYLRPSIDSFANASQRPLVYDAEKTDKMRQAFRLGSEKKLIGISWRSKNLDSGHRRSSGLSQFIRQFKDTDIEFVSLQYGDVSDEIKQAYEETGIAVKTINEIDTFNDIDLLASLISACDEVVTIDNSTVHLSAALGKTTHLLLPAVSDWRWLDGFEDCLWYKNLNIYKQPYETGWSDWLDTNTIKLQMK